MKKTSTWTFTRLERQLLFRVAREAQASSELIIASKFRFAEVVEALIFLTYFPSGSRQHKQLTTHLKEVVPVESMMDCIKRIAPDFYEEWNSRL